ncbi:HNH endonuclease [Oscillatoria sp. FACHB-1406]|uniref:HNH endonuclease n=1 Tax=Oscillatoria sp. FACHB-1406 TaxID=2692846 RepID=UPI0016888C20|nr:HNH endonuclease [Oscillatoria sp. FACHB-1406]MBD2579614.1 HNH endonuclease [Oscillatoria sp. FACHB-1406]
MFDLNQAWKCVAELRGHSSWIYGVPIISNAMLASVSGSKILLWNLNTQEIDYVFEEHTNVILSLSLSSDNRILTSGSLDKTVCLWNLETKDLICRLAKRKDPINSVVFSPDNKLLASGGESKYRTADGQKTTIYLWKVDSKELVRTFVGHDLRVNTLAFSPDGQTLASGSNDHTVRLWDVNSGRQLYILEGHSSKIGTVAFTPDGGSLISSGGGGIKVWNVQTGELQQSLAEQSEYTRCFAIDPTGQLLAFEVHNGIEIWNLRSREKAQYLDFMSPISMNFSADGKFLASGDATAFTEEGGLVKVWSVPTLEFVADRVDQNSASSELAAERQKIESEGYFDVKTLEDARRRITASIVQRQGQAEFRRKLLKSYGGRCPITNCDVESAIEAAHIIPYQGAETNHPTNGLPLRADIHTLFDLHLMSIQPDTYGVVISPELTSTCYQDLAGRKLILPQDRNAVPDRNALTKHHETFLSKCKNSQSSAS